MALNPLKTTSCTWKLLLIYTTKDILNAVYCFCYVEGFLMFPSTNLFLLLARMYAIHQNRRPLPLCYKRFRLFRSLHLLLGSPRDLLQEGILFLEILTSLSASIHVTCLSHSLLLLSTHSLTGYRRIL